VLICPPPPAHDKESKPSFYLSCLQMGPENHKIHLRGVSRPSQFQKKSSSAAKAAMFFERSMGGRKGGFWLPAAGRAGPLPPAQGWGGIRLKKGPALGPGAGRGVQMPSSTVRGGRGRKRSPPPPPPPLHSWYDRPSRAWQVGGEGHTALGWERYSYLRAGQYETSGGVADSWVRRQMIRLCG